MIPTRKQFAALTMACASLAAGPAMAAPGWTDFGLILEFNQSPPTAPGNEAFFFRTTAPVASNPSDCSTRDGYYLQLNGDLQKRLFAILSMAKLSDRRVRIHTNGLCHVWGYAEVQGMVME
jgi:hypothetical protein